MLINGKCHCGNIAFALQWQGDQDEIPARACGCSFCLKHGGLWTSNPDSKVSVAVGDESRVSKYVFGTRTATFHVCLQCGVVPVVTSEIEGKLHAVVSVNAFEDIDSIRISRATADFDGEDVASRLTRRQRNWIGDVRFVAGVA